MMTGDAMLVVTGLDAALEVAKATPDGQEMVQGLTVLQTMGAQDTVDGKPARTYKLVVGENGDILLNGTDLKPLLGMRGARGREFALGERSMKRSISFLLGAAPLWLAGGALAQTTPDAAALRDGLNEMLKPILAIQVQQQPLFTGPVTVEQGSGGATVVFPGIDLTLKGSEKDAKSVALRCDAQTYRASSTGAATWRLESSQPMNCVAEPEGEAKVTLTSRALQAHFVVDLGQKLFTEGEWRADATVLAQEGEPVKVTIDTLSGTSQLRPATAPGRHDAVLKMEARGLSVVDDKGVERVTLGHTAYDMTMDGMDVHQVISSYGEVMDVYVEMLEALTPRASRRPIRSRRPGCRPT